MKGLQGPVHESCNPTFGTSCTVLYRSHNLARQFLQYTDILVLCKEKINEFNSPTGTSTEPPVQGGTSFVAVVTKCCFRFVSVQRTVDTHTHTHTYIYIYIYIYTHRIMWHCTVNPSQHLKLYMVNICTTCINVPDTSFITNMTINSDYLPALP